MMKRTSYVLAIVLGLVGLLILLPAARAQVPSAAPQEGLADVLSSCDQLNTPSLKPDLELCVNNLVCKQVLQTRANCPAKLRFTQRLSFPNGKVTPQALWHASISESIAAQDAVPLLKQSIEWMDEAFKAVTGREHLGGNHAAGAAGFGNWVAGKFSGPSYLFYNNGDMFRGNYVDGLLNGPADLVRATGSRYLGQWERNRAHGLGIFIAANGTFVQGHFRDNIFSEGKRFRRDGTLESQGLFGPKYRLVIGEGFDASGKTSLGMINLLRADAPGEKSAAEISCRNKMVQYDREQSEKAARAPAKDLLGLSRQVMNAAKAKMDWLRIACSDWDLHVLYLWEAEDILEGAKDSCTILARKECMPEAAS